MEEIQNISRQLINYNSVTDGQLIDALQTINDIFETQNDQQFEHCCMESKRTDLLRILINYLKLKKNVDMRSTQLILLVLHNLSTSNNPQIINYLFEQQIHRIFLKFVVENVKNLFQMDIKQDQFNYVMIGLSGLSNMSQYSSQTRMSITNLNILYAVTDILQSQSYSKSLYQKMAFLIYNLSKFEQNTEHQVVRNFYNCIIRFMEIEFNQDQPDSQIINDLFWSIAYISNVNNIVNQMIDDQVFHHLQHFYENYADRKQIEEVYAYIVGIMCNTSPKSIQYFIDMNYDKQLARITVDRKNKFMNKNLLFMLSNLAISNQPIVQRMFYDDELIEYIRVIIIEEMQNEQADLKYEVFVDLIWLVANIFKQSNPDLKNILINSQLFYQFLQLTLKQQIVKKYEKMINSIIEIIVNSTQFIDSQNKAATKSREIKTLLGLLDKMEKEERIILKVFQQVRHALKNMSQMGNRK